MSRVLIVGEGLFADTLSMLVREKNSASVVDRLHLNDADLAFEGAADMTVLIFADSDGAQWANCVRLVGSLSVPIIYATPGEPFLRIFVQHRVEAELSTLLDHLLWLFNSWDHSLTQ
jgi:hypothetical protein